MVFSGQTVPLPYWSLLGRSAIGLTHPKDVQKGLGVYLVGWLVFPPWTDLYSPRHNCSCSMANICLSAGLTMLPVDLFLRCHTKAVATSKDFSDQGPCHFFSLTQSMKSLFLGLWPLPGCTNTVIFTTVRFFVLIQLTVNPLWGWAVACMFCLPFTKYVDFFSLAK